MIDDIGTHIENSRAATIQAKSQLAKAAKTQRSNSSLVTCNALIFMFYWILKFCTKCKAPS
ncbi:hypothetical protein Gotri_024772 [Gossypium trilobum]|uniref:t-SNARE coiled-coil homology domain-containing protein n=1 Tax=Gossypium trilobum TaxID=34281 RepID=A0A7J9DNC1_9ROSI|nr:hypothetical protein [Gossypium trilobum]